MTFEKEKVFLENLNEYVQDEDKIVTYKWLSCQLSIQVNYAKKLLEEYIKKYTSHDLFIIYLIIGSKNENINVTVIPESELKCRQSEFDTILSKHIYSIQKKSSTSNINTLFSVDKTKTSYLGQVKSKQCIIKKSASPVVDIPVENIVNDINKNTEKSSNNDTQKITEKSSNNVTQKSKNNIVGMFAKKQTQVETNSISENKLKTPPSSSSKMDKNEKNKNISQKGIGIFFAAKNTSIKSTNNENNSTKRLESVDVKVNSSDLSTMNRKVSKEQTKENDLNEENTCMNVDESYIKNSDKNKSINNTISKENKKNEAVRDKSTKKKLPKSNETGNKSSKRKRILVVSDSDFSEDEIFGSDSPKSPVVNISSESEENVIPSSPQISLTNRTKKRKLVDKTYLDEEGFMVTEKEFIMESESEVEEIIEIPKPDATIKHQNDNKDVSFKKDVEKKNSTKIEKPSVLKKQATLMNFFQKK